MKKTGAYLVVNALEQIGITHTFGIPGVHNTEIYDELNKSELIQPILVTHECGGAFMADGLSRTSDSIGTMVIVPAAGMSHAMSGIGEAFLDGIPMLIISGGIRTDTGHSYQLHSIDMGKVLDGIVKKYTKVETHDQIIPSIFDAYKTAISDEPGPVFVEIPVNLQLFQGEVETLSKFVPPKADIEINDSDIEQTVQLLLNAKNPGIYVGWGAVDTFEHTKKIAEFLDAPVSTTLQGISAFPANHPLHTGLGFGPASTPASQEAFKECDCMLAVGVRFSELGTGSFGVTVPENLIHIDINPEVFHKNYPAKLTITGDSKNILERICGKFDAMDPPRQSNISRKIKKSKDNYFNTWTKKENAELVSPGFFFKSLRTQLEDEAIMVVDDGNHTFLSAELFPVHTPRHFISPTDFNCMGYAIPASIGTKFANPHKTVVTIVGDGAFMMTGMELLTASTHNLGIIVFVFNDGELGQISQFQQIPLNRKTASVLGKINFEGIASGTGCEYLNMKNDADIESIIQEAKNIASQNKPVLVNVHIDYSQKTLLTKGVVKTNLSRFPFREKIRFLSRALKRHIVG